MILNINNYKMKSDTSPLIYDVFKGNVYQQSCHETVKITCLNESSDF